MLDVASEAKDELHEVFVQDHKSLPGLDARKGAFTTWLHHDTRNHPLPAITGLAEELVPMP